MKRIPVSVIVPCFNAGRTLARALQSVLAQTAQPCEIIVVDDGSDDDTRDLLWRLAEEYGAELIRPVLLERNQGAGHARNVGWDMARGEWLAFLDADDSWLPDKLERQFAYMQAHPEVLVSGHAHVISPDVAAIPADNPGALRGRRIGRFEILLRNPFVTPSVMLRRDLSLRFRSGRRFMEDHGLWQDIVFAGFRMEYLAWPLACTHKAAYGEAGLSARLWDMEKGELENYRHLFRSHRIGYWVVLLYSYSLLKFLRRMLLVTLRRAA